MVSRRDFLKGAAGLCLTAAAPNILCADTEDPVYAGWIYDKLVTKKFISSEKSPYFSQSARTIAGSGARKRALLWKFFEQVTGSKLMPHDQAIGDCVAHGWALGIDILDAIQIYRGTGQWVTKCATEVIYAGGRVEIGEGAIRLDGSHGAWAGQWCRDYGVLLRQPYLNGKYDFTTYSGAKSRQWAHICNRCTTWGGGVPDELEPLARKHPVRTITLVKSWEEARDALYNGYPVAVCSSQGFQRERRGRNKLVGVRDRDGFLTPGGKPWLHCMLLAGMDDTGSRPGGLFINSWGTEWVEGPTRFDQPVGSFWADADVIDSMLQYEDSFALSNYVGYPRQHLDYRFW